MMDYELKLNNFKDYLVEQSQQMIGYPANLAYDYSKLYDFFKITINNAGDPLSDGPYKVKTHSFEIEVVEFIAQITGIKDNDYWGYVNNGGTEGNMYGLYVAREMFKNSIVYYSSEAHYSIPKILKLLKMPSIQILANEKGEMDLADLAHTLQANKTKTPIILATVGTTMKGATDNIPEIKKIIESLSFKDHYIHCDAALSGAILPFFDDHFKFGLAHGVHSLAISGHKFFGIPMPCGIVLTKKSFVDKIGENIECIGSVDTTLSGSRNGHSTLLLWYTINKHGTDGFKKIALQCLENANYLVQKLNEKDINAWKNPHSLTVVVPRPSAKIINKWQLAIEGDIAHIITMPHVTKPLLDNFINDYLTG